MRLNSVLSEIDWTFLHRVDPERGVAQVTTPVLESAKLCIKRKRLVEIKSTHPWLNDRVMNAVSEKRDAAGNSEEEAKTAACSKVIMNEYHLWCGKVKDELSNMRPGSKAWWAKEKQLQFQKQRNCSIPALRDKAGSWIREPSDKGNLLAETFSSK